MDLSPKSSSQINPENALQRFFLAVVDRPYPFLLVSLLMIGGFGYGLTQAKLNNDPRAMFTREDKNLAALENVEAQFTRDDSLIFIVKPSNNDIFTPQHLALIAELTEAAWTLPKVMRVDSISNFQHTQIEGDELIVDDLLPPIDNLSAEKIADIKRIALNEPFLVHNVISPTGHVAAVRATVIEGKTGVDDAPAIAAAAKAIRTRLQAKYSDAEIMISGMVAFHAASHDTTRHEMETTSVYSSVVIFICLWLILRSFISVLLTFAVITLSNIMAAGGIVWFGVELTPVMGGAPAIILTLAVADSIHLLVTYQQLVAANKTPRVAMYESLKSNFQPVLLTSLTTAIGFLFLNSSKSPPFADMANMVVIGVVAAWFLSITFLPAMIMILPKQKFRTRENRSQLMASFAEFIIKGRLPIFVIAGLLSVGLAAQSVNNQLNDVWIEYFDDSYEVRRATDFMISELSGHHRIMFAFPSGQENGVMQPDYMKAVDRFVNWARQHQHVVFVSSFSDTIKRLNRDMHGGDPNYYKVPDQRDLLSQYSLMYQMSLPFGLGLENQINIDRSATRVNVLLGMLTANEINAFEQDARTWIAANLPENMHTRGVGFDLLLGNLGYENGQGMLMGTTLALLMVSVMMFISLGSFKYGLLSLLPNLFPALIAFGIWSYIDGYIGISVSIVACMTLGIIIDDTVHFITKYKRAREDLGLLPEDAVRYSFRTVGVALIATTVIIAANFGVMAMSHYYPNSSMGLLTAITVVVALLVNFFLFVPFLLFVEKRIAGTA